MESQVRPQWLMIPNKLSHLEVEQMEEPTDSFFMFFGWCLRMGENEDWLDWCFSGVNVCQQHLARKPRNRGSCSLWMLMNELSWPAVCYDKLEIQIKSPNTSNPSAKVLLLLLNGIVTDSTTGFITMFLRFLGIYLSFCSNHRTSKSKIIFPPTWARFLCWLILFNWGGSTTN